ncbi:KUP/HAK/KT family potassium transporter [Streptomyces sp. NPDC001848]|uniref:KUP/HAK/KT family potassium transporter n=1 Tax=Streptomyces sp. NPDC001848 TaxID=3364618 RepID=UPI0036ADE8B2
MYGVVSLVFCSVVVIVLVTYVLLAMRADHDGEGGIMALITLVRRYTSRPAGRTAAVLAALGIFGASLFFGDSMITPAISVLSAVEGLKVVQPSLESAVVPITAVIIVLLFLVQRRGTAAVGQVFGPVMIVWFVAIGACGVAGIADHPAILRALVTDVRPGLSLRPFRHRLRRGRSPTMAPWRKRLFTATSYITADAAEYFGLPRDRTVIMGSHIEV